MAMTGQELASSGYDAVQTAMDPCLSTGEKFSDIASTAATAAANAATGGAFTKGKRIAKRMQRSEGRGAPALKKDPYHPDEVANRQKTAQKNYGGFDAKAVAKNAGYNKRIPPQKAPFNSHGQPVYSDGKNYITPDVDGHNVTNGWKKFDKKGRRTGTWNSDLSERIKDQIMKNFLITLGAEEFESEGDSVLLGSLELNNSIENFQSSLSYWQREDYIFQWKEALDRISRGENK